MYGSNYQAQIDLATKIRQLYQSTDGVVDVDWYMEAPQTDYHLEVDRAKAALSVLLSQRLVIALVICLSLNSSFQESYQKHIQHVQNYFAHRPQDLLIMNIADGYGWERLCPFVGRPIPDLPFPHQNKNCESVDMICRELSTKLAQSSGSLITGEAEQLCLNTTPNFTVTRLLIQHRSNPWLH